MPVPFPKTVVERRTLREISQERIKEAILDGTFEPGERLNDKELMEWLGVSRTPLREALNELARVGLVEMEAQKFTRVATPNESRATDYLQTVGALLGGVVRVTVPALDAAARADIGQRIGDVIDVVNTREGAKHAKLAWSTFDAIIGYCPNQVLVDATRDTIESVVYRFGLTEASRTTEWEQLSERYATLQTAVLSNDAIAAELAIEVVFRLPEANER